MAEEPGLRFEIIIQSCEHHTWQGILCYGGEQYPFPSELALLIKMEQVLKQNGICMDLKEEFS